MYYYSSYLVPFSETDAMAIVHHSNHARYFERARIDLLKQVGIRYSELCEKNNHFPVLELQCRYLQPIKFDEDLILETSLTQLTKLRLAFQYRIFKLNGREVPRGASGPWHSKEKPMATGFTSHCCIDPNGKPMKIESTFYEKLEKALVRI